MKISFIGLYRYQKHRFCKIIYSEMHCSSVVKWIKPDGDATDISVYNPIIKMKVPFITTKEKFITWYACGPTVYDSAHIGHACSYMKFDIIRRILERYIKKDIFQVMCITDIDDKIIQRAAELNMHWKVLTDAYAKEFFSDLDALNVKKPTLAAKTSNFIPQIITFITNLLEKKIAYVTTDGSVYFSIKQYGKHGKLMKQNPNTIQNQIENILIKKKCFHDFALWKSAKPGEPFWKAPWGNGRPGWHIECSAIASHYFGNVIDVHTGGIDLLFPHHENEESQCCAFHNIDQWVNYWLHSGHLVIKDNKMSKSSGNTINIKDYLSTNSPIHLRMLCLSTNYRTNIDFYDDQVIRSVNLCAKFYEFFDECRAYMNGYSAKGNIDSTRLLQILEITNINVDKYLKDDFSTELCIESICSLMSETFSMLHAEPGSRCIITIYLVYTYVEKVMDMFGFNFSKKHISDVGVEKSSDNIQSIIDGTINFRNNVRNVSLLMKKEKNVDLEKTGRILLELCDNVRQEFSYHGIIIKDRKDDLSTWSYVKSIKKKEK